MSIDLEKSNGLMIKAQDQSSGVGSLSNRSDINSTSKFKFLHNEKGDLSKYDTTDPAIRAKITLINDALDEIGFTWYHLKLFFLNGMGYAVDSQLTFIQSSVAQYVRYQFDQAYPYDSHAAYIGLLFGACLWGFGADLFGRKLAFNSSLLISAVFAILAGTMGNYGTYCLFVALASGASGGNLVLDTTVFLEFLPSKDQWLVTFMASWWGVGQTIAVLTAWLFFSHDEYICAGKMGNCPSEENRGWRYVWLVNGGFVLIIAILRLTIIKLEETPKFLVCNQRDSEAVECLQNIAKKYNRTCSLTLEQLESCGEITGNANFYENSSVKGTIHLVKKHLKVLFANRLMRLSSSLLFTKWTLLGISYPLYSNFLPYYLASRGANISAGTTAGVYRDTLISAVASIAGGFIGGGILYVIPALGRRGVMVIGGLMSMALFFGYTQVRTRTQNVALSSSVYIAINIYYSCLYAYTPEVMSSSARATGNAICVACTRIMSSIVPAIGYYADTSSSVPVWICGACVGVISLCSIFLPFEPSKQRIA